MSQSFSVTNRYSFFIAKEEERKNWHTNQVGEAFNETQVHESGQRGKGKK
jgi:hypothetical protein